MMKTPSKRSSRLVPVLAALVSLGLAGGGGYMLLKKQHSAEIIDDGTMTGSIMPPAQVGPSGLPLPRFVSLKAEKVNVRKGPSSDHAVAWVYQAKGLPVEITAEFETWRRVRDAEGSEGWILHNMLSGKRTAEIAPSRKGTFVNLMSEPSIESAPLAKLASGVLSDIKSCDGNWCRIIADGYDGYIDQNLLWGAYPGEVIN